MTIIDLMSMLESLSAVLISGIGSLFQGLTGLGLNLFAAPFLMMIEPAFVPGPIMAASIFLTIFIVLRDRTGIDLHGVGWLTTGMIPGCLLGAILLPIVPVRILAIVLGILVLIGVVASLGGFHFQPRWWVLLAAGFLSGLGGTMASIGGPPPAVVLQDMEPRRLRATLSGYFLLLGIISVLSMVPAGRFGLLEIRLTGWVLIGAVIGFLTSYPIVSRIDKRISRYGVLVLSALSAILLLVRQI
ncbi:MAG: TSUP family transporter [Anaerolineaceae bacterium]